MSQNSQTSDKDGGSISTIVRRLQPRSIERLILIALLLLTVILAIAIYTGSKISFLGITIEALSHESEKSKSPASSDQTSEIPSPNISVTELSMISDKFFDPKLTKDQLIAGIRNLVECSEELESFKNQFSFKLLKLELLIPKFGRYIDTKIGDEDQNRKEAFERIQSVLKDIGYYNGIIDGNQQATFNVLSKFQIEYNRRAGREILVPEDYGIFGYATLEAIRSTYRTRN